MASFFGSETGIGHCASALGKDTLMIFAWGDAGVWNTGKLNLYTLSAPHALQASLFNMSLNYRAVGFDIFLIKRFIETAEIHAVWEEIVLKKEPNSYFK